MCLWCCMWHQSSSFAESNCSIGWLQEYLFIATIFCFRSKWDRSSFRISSGIDHHSERGNPPSSTDWRGLAIWGVKFQSFNSNFQNVVEQHETPSPYTSSTIFVFNLYQSKRTWRKNPHFLKNFVFDALNTDCSYQILHLSLFSQRRVSSEIPILIGFRFAINCTTKLYLTASTTRKSETVLKETFWSQCWRRVWYSHVGLKKGVVFTCGSEKASFNRFGAIAC